MSRGTSEKEIEDEKKKESLANAQKRSIKLEEIRQRVLGSERESAILINKSLRNYLQSVKPQTKIRPPIEPQISL